MPAQLLDADYAAIEARIVCWLAGQDDALDEYRAQDAATDPEEKIALDRYRIMAAYIFSILINEVQKFPHRFVGKEAILGCGFGLGYYMFWLNCQKKGSFVMDISIAAKAVKGWREKHDKVVQYWEDVETSAKLAVQNPGDMYQVRNVAFLCETTGGIPYLFIRLPSGRKLCYPRPRLIYRQKQFPIYGKDKLPLDPPQYKVKTVQVLEFFGHIKGNTWGWVDTYGGKLVENITQAVAADIMANGAYNAERAGYHIATLIHDQALAYFRPSQNVEEFVERLTHLPPWGDGLPLAAEGGLVPFYKKD